MFLFFIHLKLELLTQFPASNDEKYVYLWKMAITEIELFDYLASTKSYVTNLIIFYFVWNLLENVHIYGLSCTMGKQNITEHLLLIIF